MYDVTTFMAAWTVRTARITATSVEMQHRERHGEQSGSTGSVKPDGKAGFRSGTASTFQTSLSSAWGILMAIYMSGGSEESARRLISFDNGIGSLRLM